MLAPMHCLHLILKLHRDSADFTLHGSFMAKPTQIHKMLCVKKGKSINLAGFLSIVRRQWRPQMLSWQKWMTTWGVKSSSAIHCMLWLMRSVARSSARQQSINRHQLYRCNNSGLSRKIFNQLFAILRKYLGVLSIIMSKSNDGCVKYLEQIDPKSVSVWNKPLQWWFILFRILALRSHIFVNCTYTRF